VLVALVRAIGIGGGIKTYLSAYKDKEGVLHIICRDPMVASIAEVRQARRQQPAVPLLPASGGGGGEGGGGGGSAWLPEETQVRGGLYKRPSDAFVRFVVQWPAYPFSYPPPPSVMVVD